MRLPPTSDDGFALVKVTLGGGVQHGENVPSNLRSSHHDARRLAPLTSLVLDPSTSAFTSVSKATVRLSDGEVIEAEMDQLLPCNTTVADGCDDITALPRLNEATVLAHVKQRYANGALYTWLARILIALNPFEEIASLYGPEMQSKFAKLDPRSAPAHLYAVGEAAFRGVMRASKQSTSQAVIVSGESGAGKTVANRHLMDYVAYRSTAASGSGAQTTQRMSEANPIFEAFGNAKTTRNDNSSRFGKFQLMHFSSSGAIDRVSISTYLLEKSRVASIADPERNYHIFYMFLKAAAGSTGGVREGCQLTGHAHDYFYLSQSKCVEIAGAPDGMRFDELHAALGTVGLTHAEQAALYQTVAALLHLGNLTFEPVSVVGPEPRLRRGTHPIGGRSSSLILTRGPYFV